MIASHLREVEPLCRWVDELWAKHDQLAEVEAHHKSGKKYDEKTLALQDILT